MFSPVTKRSSIDLWNDLSVVKAPDRQQLDKIQTNLRLLLIALESLGEINFEAILEAGKKLNLDSKRVEGVAIWHKPEYRAKRSSGGETIELDLEEARSLVLIICYLAKKRQELIRRACSSIELTRKENPSSHHSVLLGDYLARFEDIYREHKFPANSLSENYTRELAFKLIIDLMFYGTPNGHRRLWKTLLSLSVG